MGDFVEEKNATFVNPITYALEFLADYGWYLVGVGALSVYMYHKLQPKFKSWQQAREDAEYHKDPDKALSCMQAVQRAREQQQRELEERSLRAAEQQIERERRKRQENLERLQKYGADSGAGERLGRGDEYLPLSGPGGSGASGSYRPPKRSACARGGCGR